MGVFVFSMPVLQKCLPLTFGRHIWAQCFGVNPSFHSVACHFFCLHSTYTSQPCSHFTAFLTFAIQHSEPKKWAPNSLVGKIFWELWYIPSPDGTRECGGWWKTLSKVKKMLNLSLTRHTYCRSKIWWGSILILAKVYAWEPSILQCKSWLECNKPYHWANHKLLESLKFIVKHDLECKKTFAWEQNTDNQTKLN
jgi:hypothetical protein